MTYTPSRQIKTQESGHEQKPSSETGSHKKSTRSGTHVVFRVSVVGHDGDDGVVDEEAEGQHPAEAAEGRPVHRDVLGWRDVVEVDVDAPLRRVVADDADQEDDCDGAFILRKLFVKR